MSMMYEVKVTAVGEVRDADGKLISSFPVETTQTMIEEEVRAFQEGNN